MDYTKWPLIRTEFNYPTCYVVYENKFIIKYSKYGNKNNVSKHTSDNKFIKWIK